VGPLAPADPVALRAGAARSTRRRRCRRERRWGKTSAPTGEWLRLKRPRALCTSVPRFLHRPGVTN